MVKFKKKISKMGKNYIIIVPKQLVDCEVLSLDREIEVELHNAPLVLADFLEGVVV